MGVEILQRDMYFYLNRLVKSHINITPDALLFLEQAQPQEEYFSDLIIKLSYSQDFDSHLTLQDIEKIIRENPSMEKYFANKKHIERCILIPPVSVAEENKTSIKPNDKSMNTASTIKENMQINSQEINKSRTMQESNVASSITNSKANKSNSALTTQNKVVPSEKNQISPQSNKVDAIQKSNEPMQNKPDQTQPIKQSEDPTLELMKQIEFELNDANFKENGRFKKITEIKSIIPAKPSVSKQKTNGKSNGNTEFKLKPNNSASSPSESTKKREENAESKKEHKITNETELESHNTNNEGKLELEKKSMNATNPSPIPNVIQTTKPSETNHAKNEVVMKFDNILGLDSQQQQEANQIAPENNSAQNKKISIAEQLKNKLKYLTAKNREGCIIDPDSDEINPEESEDSEEEPHVCEPVVDIKEVIPRLEKITLKEDIKDEKNKYFETLITKIRSGYSSFKPIAKEYDADVKILKDPTGKLYTDGKVEDFHAVAFDKYEKLKKIMMRRPEAIDAVTISQVKKLTQESEVKIIGMVMEKRVSNSGTMILTLEDPSATIKAIIRNGKGNEDLIAKAVYILEDTMIMVEGFMQINKYDKSKIIFVNDLEFPDIESDHVPNFPGLDLSICCLSDIHFGSKQHIDILWERFVKLLKGELGTENQQGWAGSIKYITIAGDLVDGIGIYPNQEKNLTHLDIYDQYKYAAERFAELPDYIQIIFVPGDHDPVRKALPSPRVDKEIIQPLLDLGNVTCLGAPSMVSLHGIKTLIYHGESMIDINMLPGMSNDNVPKSMKILLENRHLVPIYGKKTQMASGSEDHLVIDTIPDIFHTGHLHKNGYSVYHGVALVNAGCFQEQTEFMASLGIIPDCGKIPIINIKGPSFKPKIIDLGSP